MSIRESGKSLKCLKKVFPPQKKKKEKKKAQKEVSLISPPAQCLDKDPQNTAEP